MRRLLAVAGVALAPAACQTVDQDEVNAAPVDPAVGTYAYTQQDCTSGGAFTLNEDGTLDFGSQHGIWVREGDYVVLDLSSGQPVPATVASELMGVPAQEAPLNPYVAILTDITPTRASYVFDIVQPMVRCP